MAVRRILTLTSSFAIATGVAHASPRSDPTTGRAVFTGAASPGAPAIVLDPAALGVSPVDEIYIGLLSVLDQFKIDRRTLDLASGTLGDGPNVSSNRFGPGASLGFVWHPSDRLALGFEAKIPPPEQFLADQQPLRYHTLGTDQRTYLATVGVSLKVTRSFYFGASLSHENTYLHLRYARDVALEAGHGAGGVDSDCGGGVPCGVENPAATELYDVDVSSPWVGTQNLKVNLGAIVQVAPDVFLGVAYHTPPGFDVQTSLTGSMDVTRAPRDGGGVVSGDSTVYVSFPASVDAEVRARLPSQLELHVGGRWEDLSRMQAYDVRGIGTALRAANVPEWMERARGLKDSFAAWGGIEQVDLGKRWRFGGRLGFETASLADQRTSPLTISPLSLTLDLGAQLRLGAWLVQLSYGLQYFNRVNVDHSAYDPRHRLDCIESGYDYSTPGCEAVREGYALPTADGDYSRIQHAVRLGFRYEIP